jgi:8-oxo-dGTP diphosphatase
MAAAVLFRDALDRILLVEPVYKPDWELPGGAVDADESPYDAARREVNEELALTVAPGRLLVVDWVPPRPGRTEGVMFVYDGGLLGNPESAAAIQLPSDELRSWAWCTIEDTRARASALVASRAVVALEAALRGGSCYLENGVAVC